MFMVSFEFYSLFISGSTGGLYGVLCESAGPRLPDVNAA
jgi:hypothetical protein